MSNTRRQFFRGAGMTVGSLAGLGLRADSVGGGETVTVASQVKIEGTKEFASVCPYCAVGCGQIVSVREERIVNIEGNPDSPINRGTLCPKGAATYQLAVNPNRLTKALYRAPRATSWKEVELDWAMDQIAQRIKTARDRDFVETWMGKDAKGEQVTKSVNHCGTIASLGGATMDNEWNYAHLKLWRGLGGIWLENQARI